MIYTENDLKAMGYTYKNMIGLTPELARRVQVSFNLPLYELLVDDDTESLIEDDIITVQHNDSRVFGVDKLNISQNMKSEFYAKLMEFVLNEDSTADELPYEQSLRDSSLNQLLVLYSSDEVSIHELLEFSDIVDKNRFLTAKMLLDEWQKYHLEFNK